MERITLITDDTSNGVDQARSRLGYVRLALKSGRKAKMPSAMRAGYDFIEPSAVNPLLLNIQNLSERMSIKRAFHIVFREEVYIAGLF